LLYLSQAIVLGLSMILVISPPRTRQVAELQADGPGHAAPFVLSAFVGDIPRALVTLLLLAQLPAWFLEACRLVGGMLLIYLVWRAIREPYRPKAGQDSRAMGMGEMDLLRGLALRLLDPASYLLWITVIGPLLLASWRHEPIWGLAFLGCLYGALILGGGMVGALVANSGKLARSVFLVTLWICVVMLILLAVLQIWMGSQALITRFFQSG
jgi:threonine/homoserine/homoserine lactone efflux protein